jgi:2-oxoglutarate ferredoxin oxidoreductase subunit beta
MSTAADFQFNIKQNWCPGCGDFAVQAAIQRALAAVNAAPHEVVIVSGIGCSSRLPGYVNAYGFHSTHGRALPLAQGVKLANPDLTVLACGGDGDGFAIGIGHTIHAMRRDIDITYIVMDNHVYGLTKGQVSPRSDLGFKTKTSPLGSTERPVSALELALSAGAGFVAQGFSRELNELTQLIEAGIRHRGFSFINVFSPCVTFNKVNTYEWYGQRIRKLSDMEGYDTENRVAAMRYVMENEGLVTGLIYERKS